MPLSLLAALVLQSSAEIPITKALGISGVTQGGRVPAPIDLVQSQIVDGSWKAPNAGDKMAGVRGEVAWTELTANKDGVFEGPATRGGYVFATYDSPKEQPMLLQAAGDSLVYINGVPRGGDPYSYGYLKIPFLAKKGKNEFLFSCGRGQLQAKLMEPMGEDGLWLNPDDLTLPDILIDKNEDLVGGITVVNCSARPRTELTIEVMSGQDHLGTASVPRLEPFSIRKVPFTFTSGARSTGGEIELTLDLFERYSDMIDQRSQAKFKVRVRKPTEHYKRTFISKIDGSVQYYAVAPALKPSKDNALILTVHGASVEALNQAQAYKPKDWCTVVAATNRRPFGFDWEDWGRMDGMEVLELAEKEFPHDPSRVILTGHSMGGHGTWQLGLTYPNEFAAIGPSAGWISFWSYAGGWQPRDPNAVEQMLFRSTGQSDTLKMLPNALMQDVYILHGDKDDNVPVEQARTMKGELEKIGAKFAYHEQPGAGHWWGDECVDWPPMFEMFSKARLSPRDHWKFTTMNPAVSSTFGGVTIEQQFEALKPSTVEASRAEDGTWRLTTTNVAKLTLDPAKVNPRPKIILDGYEMTVAAGNPTDVGKVLRTLIHGKNGPWLPALDPFALRKSANRSGPFKLAFQNRMAFVVGTKGTKAENEWAMNKARFDAEQWYYRGNGSVDIVLDKDVTRFKDRNLVLYGNSDANAAFRFVSHAPIRVNRKQISVGPNVFKGEDLATVFLYPEGPRLIAVVAGTGMKGLRYTDRMAYFTSGVAYPDWAVFGASCLKEGSKGALAAGFFGNAWEFDPAQSAVK